ncbi:MAG: hypothetical protein ACXVUE_02990 [Solirubrobacteraceae bacterium]
MEEPDANRRFSDREIDDALRRELRNLFEQCARQCALAKRQRNSAASMRREAHAMRARVRWDWLRAP